MRLFHSLTRVTSILFSLVALGAEETPAPATADAPDPATSVSLPSELVGTWRILELQDDAKDQNGRIALPPNKKVGANSKARLIVATDGTCQMINGSGKHQVQPGMSHIGWARIVPVPEADSDAIDIVSHHQRPETGEASTYVGRWGLVDDELSVAWQEESKPRRPGSLQSDGGTNTIRAVRVAEE